MQTHTPPISARILDIISTNIVAIASILLVGTMALGLYLGYRWYEEKTELAAAEEFAPLEKQFTEKREGFARAKYMALDKKNRTDKDKKDKTNKSEEPKGLPTGELTKDYGDLTERLKAFVQTHPKQSAATVAALYLADLQAEYKQDQAASETLESRLPQLAKKSVLYPVTLMKLGNIQSALKDCEKASQSWDKIVQVEEHKEFHAEALFRRAICLEDLKKVDEAKQVYRQITEKFPQSQRSRTAQKYLLLLESAQGS